MHKTRNTPRKLSPQWFRLFRDRLPHDKHLREWRTRDLNLQDFGRFKDIFFEDRTTIVLGGKVGSPMDVYKSPGDLDAFFTPGAQPTYDPSVQFGHMCDRYLGPNVYHFPNIDAPEVLIEEKEQCQRTGEAVVVSRDVLTARAESLVQDNIFQKANTILINYAYEVPLQDNCSFGSFLNYLDARGRRSNDAVIAICNALADLPVSSKAGGTHVVPVYNTFFLLPRIMHAQQDKNPWRDWKTHIGVYCSKLLEETGITFETSVVYQLMPHILPITEDTCRHHLRDPRLYNQRRNDRMHGWGLQLAGKEMMRAYGDNYLIDPDLKARFYDRVLFEVLRTQWFERRDNSLCLNVIRRQEVISEYYIDPVTALSKKGADDDGAGHISTLYLNGAVALVLDSGRRDGVTEACCLELAQQGCHVALVFDGSSVSFEAAYGVARKIKKAKGKCEIVPGCPYRYEAYSNGGEGAIGYLEKTVQRALTVLGASGFDIIVNNVGCAYDLRLATTRQEKTALLKMDSIRNLLALNYVVEYCVEHRYLEDGARVINIAGLAVNPNIPEHWASTFHFLEKWTDLASAKRWSFLIRRFRTDKRQTWWYSASNPNFRENDSDSDEESIPILVTTILPAMVMERDLKNPTGTYTDRWWGYLDAMQQRWSVKKMLVETARIVGLLALPECTLIYAGIAPDDSVLPNAAGTSVNQSVTMDQSMLPGDSDFPRAPSIPSAKKSVSKDKSMAPPPRPIVRP